MAPLVAPAAPQAGVGFVGGHPVHRRLQHPLLLAVHLGQVHGAPGEIGLMGSAKARYLVLLVALAAGLWVPRLRGPLDLRYDAGVYYILGTSLAEGRGYRLLSEPGSIQAVQYPPLLPLIVAAHQRLAGTSDPAIAGHWLRITYAVVFLAYILAVYSLASRFLPAGFAFVAGL